MVSHFHYDPVWWNTQGQFTESRLLLPDEAGRLPDARTAFELVRLHLDEARQDPDYKFVLAEIDYLKPHFDAHPEDRADLLEFIAAGRIEIVGGSYNEPNTNLTSAESTIRNAIYGLGYQRDVLGADPKTAWMLDAFGLRSGLPGPDGRGGPGRVRVGQGPVPSVGPEPERRRQHPDAVPQRVRVDLAGWRRPADRLHAQSLRGGLGDPGRARPGRGAAGRVRAVRAARAGRRDPQRAAAGRRRPRDPVPLGDPDLPGLERPLRLAAVRDRGARASSSPRCAGTPRGAASGSPRRPGT